MIGKMDQRVVIQRATATPDGIGGSTVTWANIASVWAAVTPFPMKVKEEMIEGRMTATQPLHMRIYARRDLTEKDRVLWDGRTFNIRGIPLDSLRSQFMDLVIEAGVAS